MKKFITLTNAIVNGKIILMIKKESRDIFMKKHMYKLLRKIYIILKSTDEQKALFHKLQAGDMVWAKMPLTNKELKKMEESHRIRPYLIVEKNESYLTCYQSSSKSRRQFNNYEEFNVNRFKYRKKRDSWIDLTKTFEIPINNIESKYIQLDEIDIKKIEKRLSIEFNRENKEITRFDKSIYINVGDVIVKNNTQYYIYEEDNIFIYCLKIQKKKKEKLKAIIINRKTYYINFKDKISFRRNEKMKIINIANSDEILMIENQMNDFKKNNKEKIKNEIEYEEIVFDIGTVFEYGNSKVMYLYTDNHKYYGIDLLWYLIRPRIFEIKDIEKRQILEIKNIEVINKVIENLLEKDIKNKKKLEEVYEYIRSLLYYSIA